MEQKRRAILKGGVALAAASILPAQARSNPTAGSLDRTTHELHETLIEHFKGKGYELAAPSSIVTGDEGFNGGLRYDESGHTLRPGQMAIQPCARTEDIRDKDKADVLPLFHLFYCVTPPGLEAGDTLAHVLDYLTNRAALDTGKFAFVTIPEFEPHLPKLEKYGFDTGRQIHFRNSEMAMKEGDGSGYFRFPGKPDAEGYATIGLYYWTGDGAPPKLAEYPPQPGWSEIGEASIDDGTDLGFGLGTERLGLAMKGNIPSWKERLVLLFEEIEINSAGNPPPGKDQFANG